MGGADEHFLYSVSNTEGTLPFYSTFISSERDINSGYSHHLILYIRVKKKSQHKLLFLEKVMPKNIENCISYQKYSFQPQTENVKNCESFQGLRDWQTLSVKGQRAKCSRLSGPYSFCHNF